MNKFDLLQSLNQLEWVSPQTGVDDEGVIIGYKKNVHVERIVSLSETITLEGCLTYLKILCYHQEAAPPHIVTNSASHFAPQYAPQMGRMGRTFIAPHFSYIVIYSKSFPSYNNWFVQKR